MSAPVPSNEARNGMDAEGQRELLEAMLAALANTVGRDEHLRFLRELVETRAGPTTFSQLAIAAGRLDLSERSEEWRRNGRSLWTRSHGPLSASTHDLSA